MKQQPISSPDAPTPVGPYSPALVWNNLIFISGQGPLDPKTGKRVEGDISAQTRQVFSNLDALLKAASSLRENVLKVTVYLAHIEDFAEMNVIYKDFFAGMVFPARTTIQAGALPGGIDIEIDIIAYKQ